MQSLFARVVIEFIRVVTIVLWSIIGLFFWIPFLARMTLVFVGMIVISVFSDADLISAELGLDKATKFYVMGFTKINYSINSIIQKAPYAASIKPLESHIIKNILVEIIYTLLFWALTVIAIITAIKIV